jgi:hypothetical protein
MLLKNLRKYDSIERGHPKMSTGKFWLIRHFFPKMSTPD